MYILPDFRDLNNVTHSYINPKQIEVRGFYFMKFKLSLIFFLLGSSVPCSLFCQAVPKKLIEFGWDYPTVNKLKSEITEMEKAPFDGVVFSIDVDVFNVFDTVKLPDTYFKYDDLTKIKWKKFTDNFLFVRGIGHSGPHWLDDKSWQTISRNIEKLSKAIAVSNAKGIGFDAEYYYEDPTMNPWIYKPSLYNNLTYQQVGNFVRKRGSQFIRALQKYKPDVKILSFWLLGLVIDQNKNRPLPETDMALLPFFVEGMLESKTNASEIIDGNETAYWYTNPEDFILSGERLRNQGAKLILPALREKYKAISLAQCVYLDGLYAKFPEAERGFDKPTKERWLRNNLYHAYKTTDNYIWFYNEKINWWQDKVDSGVREIIEETKKVITAENNIKSIAPGQSKNFSSIEKPLVQEKFFEYNYVKSSNSIRIKLTSKSIKRLRLFQNSRQIYTITNPAGIITIPLNKIYNKQRSLIIITEDENLKIAVSYVN